MKKTVLFILGFLCLIGSAWGDYVVNFEGDGETKGAYASGTVNLSGLDWDMTEALIGTLAADWKNGLRSARMRGYGTSAMTMLENKTTGMGTLSFYYRRYGTDAQVDWRVEYSVNDGTDWIQIGSDFTAPASDDVQLFSQTANIEGNVRIRIKRATETGTSNRRLNIDDITLTDYPGGGPSAPAITHTAQGNTTSTSAITINADITDADADLTITAGSAPSCYYRIDGGSWTGLEDTTPVGDTFSWDIPGQSTHTLVEYYIAAQDDASNVTTSPSGGSGTTPPGSTPPASFHTYNVLKASPTIYDVQNYRDGSDNSYYSGETVSLTGIVTAQYSSGYYFQNGAGAWNGVYVYDTSNSAVVGDDATITGTVTEYFNLTEITPVTSYILNSSGNTLPAATSLTTGNIPAEDYEGVLVTVQNANCTNPSLGSGEWEIDDGSGACRVDDQFYAFTPTLGNSYDITGPLNYGYSNYKIEPRDANDVTESQNNSILTGDPVDFTFNGGGGSGGSTVTIDPPAGGGSITITQYDDPPASLPFPGNALDLWYDIDGTSYSGGFPVDVTFTWDTPVPAGSSAPILVVSTDGGSSWQEATTTGWNLTTLSYWVTFTASSFSYYAMGNGADNPLPIILTNFTAQFINDNLTVLWTTQSETNNSGWNIYRGESEYALENDETIQINNTGLIEGAGNSSQPIDYSFQDEYTVVENNTYWYWLESVSYSNDTEIYGPISFTIPEGAVIPELPILTFMNSNYPNPFNPETKIEFDIKEGENGSLSIYNAKGQLLETYRYEAGEHELTWDATQYGSGIYFYKLETQSYTETKKMIMVK